MRICSRADAMTHTHGHTEVQRWCPPKKWYKYFDEKGFKREVAEMRWSDIYSTENVNIAFDLLTTKLASALDKFAPIKTIQKSVQWQYQAYHGEER